MTLHRTSGLLLSKWIRLTRWEYWPPGLAYLPLAGWIGVLAIKHRSLVAFTAANPAIPAGGFIGESKFAILEGLVNSQDRVARGELIPGSLTESEKRDRVQHFMERERLSLPVVLKPNEGSVGLASSLRGQSTSCVTIYAGLLSTRSSRNTCRASSSASSTVASLLRRAVESSLLLRSVLRSSSETDTGRSSA